VDENANVVLNKRISNDLEAITFLLKPYSGAIKGLAVESTYNWYWLVDGLMVARFKVHLANTAAIQRYSGLKYGDDDSDASCLVNMLRLGILPEGLSIQKKKE